ncbi:hypothetical protein HN587_03600 [Candidatus Woesearchaeota archaeon]|jgi:hypothetical protein|nr:hypothetical protein [Candidatus Woesearchaeota archaeon]
MKSNELIEWKEKVTSATSWTELIGKEQAKLYRSSIEMGLPIKIGQDPKFPLVLGTTLDYGATYRFEEMVQTKTPDQEKQPDWCGNYMNEQGKHFQILSAAGVPVIQTPKGTRSFYSARNI